MDIDDHVIADIRHFNRFYTNILGVLERTVLNTGYSLAEARVIIEIGMLKQCIASNLVDSLEIDRSYLSRIIAKLGDLPLLEPATIADSKDMVRHAFEVSREIGNVCLVRSVTRISHARGNVTLGPLPETRPVPHFDTSVCLSALPPLVTHPVAHARLEKAADLFRDSPYNTYTGPEKPELLVISCGAASLFASEAIEILGIGSSVGLLTIGTT